MRVRHNLDHRYIRDVGAAHETEIGRSPALLWRAASTAGRERITAGFVASSSTLFGAVISLEPIDSARSAHPGFAYLAL